MPGGEQKQPYGYTIIEVMIVLAVSGIMFVIAASFINGRQQQTAFTEGVREMASNIQSTIEQVADGNYSDQHLKCTPNPGTSPSLTLGGNQQGTNAGCVFFGKLMKFHSSSTASDYQVYSLAGCQSDIGCGGDLVAPHLKVAGLVAVAPADSPVDLTAYEHVPQGLSIKYVTIYPVSAPPFITNNATNANNIAFLQTIGQNKLYQDGNYASGASSVELAYAVGPAPYNGNISSSHHIKQFGTNWANAAKICITDHNHYAEIDLGDPTGVGAQGSQLNVTVKVDVTC